MRSDFAAFILSHGRPDAVQTVKALESGGYTGAWYVVIDDEDPDGDEYRRRYGERVLVFSKEEVGRTFDHYDNSPERRSVVWARNACWQLARDVGVRYFIQLDDDYFNFSFRRGGKRTPDAEYETYHGWTIRNLDAVLEAMVRFVATTPAETIAMSQGGDHIGGKDSSNAMTRLRRKVMNSFVCDVERPFTFQGRINEDVNTYVTRGALGSLFFTHTDIQLEQEMSQTAAGGMTGLYLESGTYVKSFFTVIAAPSCVRIGSMGRYARRLHHRISWRHAVPQILSERHARPS